MSNQCFEGFEGEQGFFGIYFGVFEKLATDERAAVERRRELEDMTDDNEEEEAAPVFGYHDTRWEYVDGFYRYWSDFESQRQMVWADVYDLQEAPDVGRRVKWEKENRKARREERKKASWHVRELVQFVKRRDPRVAAFLAEQKEVKSKAKGMWEQKKQSEREAQEEENANFAAEQTERYKELEEGEDPFTQLCEWMLGLGLKPKEAQKYASALVEEGHESLGDVAKLTPGDLKDIGVKKNQIGTILEEAQAETGVAPGGEEEASVVEEGGGVDDSEFFSRGAVEKKDRKWQREKKKKAGKAQVQGARSGQGSCSRGAR